MDSMYNSKLKAARLKRGWSQTTLAYLAHVTVADVSRIETLRMKPYPKHAERLGLVLGLRPDELQQPASTEVSNG